MVLGLLDWMEVLGHHLLVALPRLDHLRLGRRHPTREDGLANVATGVVVDDAGVLRLLLLRSDPVLVVVGVWVVRH